MNPQLPEIVKALKVTGPNGEELCHDFFAHFGEERYGWLTNEGASIEYVTAHDAENACVVALLGRLVANGLAVQLDRAGVWCMGKSFDGDLLSALYAAFQAHPEWFKENRT